MDTADRTRPARARRAAIVGAAWLTLACGGVPADAGPDRSRPPATGSTVGAEPSADGTAVEVVRVLDGDTLDVRIDGVRDRVRLLGIDAPEGGDGGPREPLYAEATAFVERAVTPGGVVLIADHLADDRDRYERLLRHVRLADGRWLAESMLREGLGVALTQWPYARADVHVAAEAEARESGRGVWSPAVAPTVPWDEAPDHLGRIVRVEGTIVSARCPRSTCYLNFHEDYANHVSAVILGADRHRFPEAPDRTWERRTVRIVGQVTEHRGRPQILLRHPGQVTVLDR
jgi:endonuclease YncB( thermonuclease family)